MARARRAPALSLLCIGGAMLGLERWNQTLDRRRRTRRDPATVELLTRPDHVDEAGLRQAEEQFRSAFDGAAAGMALTDLEGRWMRVNPAFAELLGRAPGELVGRRLHEVIDESDPAREDQALADVVSGALPVYRAEKRYRRADGELGWVTLTVSPVRDAEGRATHLISQLQDITDRKNAERELVQRALNDPLTGLPNRRLFLRRVQEALDRLWRRPGPVAVFFIDLDRFKLVNDSLGHSAGDHLLLEVANRLRHVLRAEDLVSRFGGDEFTIVCEDTDEEAARRMAQRIQIVLDQPVLIDGQELFVSAAVGVSLCREEGMDAEAMLRDADAAMYRAKAEGRGRCVVFAGAMRDDATERLTLENDLRRAVVRRQLRLLYQPLVDLQTGRLYGVEALIRWEHPNRGLLGPGQFIDLAEETGMIVPIGRWVLDEACRQSRAWRDAGLDLLISVNLSPRQLIESSLVDDVERTMRRHGVAPGRVCLELTESAAIDGGAPLRELRALGVSIALDDFGTGFSSLDQIRRLPPVDALKIDRSFVSELGSSPAGSAIAAAIIGISSALELATVAEGIEEQSQVAALLAAGCARGQGFFFARPVAPGEIERLAAAVGTATEIPGPGSGTLHAVA